MQSLSLRGELSTGPRPDTMLMSCNLVGGRPEHVGLNPSRQLTEGSVALQCTVGLIPACHDGNIFKDMCWRQK